MRKKYHDDCIFNERAYKLFEEWSIKTYGKMSQPKVVDFTGIKQATISKIKISYENPTEKQFQPPAETLCKIAKAFNVSTDYLLGLTETKTTDKASRALCDTLGLSEEVIDLLTCNEASQYHKYIIEFYANIEGFKQRNIDGVEVGRGIARLNAERITACINQMLSEYIQDSINTIKSDIPGDSVLEHLVAFYELLNETPSPKYGEINTDDEEILHAIVSEHLINSRTYDTGTRGVKLSELVINSQILEISSKLNQMKHDKMKERERNENEA